MQFIKSLGYDLCWDTHVYKPSDDTLLLMKALEQLFREEGRFSKLLDVGTGTGILALHMLELGAKEVVAIDLSPHATRTAYCTLLLNNHRFSRQIWNVARCDLTSCLGSRVLSFDMVVFNPPYLPSDGRSGGWIDKAWDGGPTGLEVLERFLDELAGLGYGNRILFVVSSLSGEELDKLYERLAHHRVVGTMSFFFEKLYAVEATIVGEDKASIGGHRG